MNQVREWIAYVVGFFIVSLSLFLYGKRQGKNEANSKAIKNIKKTKAIDNLTSDELFNILSNRIHK